MVRSPLPRELATPARSYLAAFLGEREAADALHEVSDDVAYWGDDSLPAVMAVTHEVLKSRARVAPEAAISWLVDELGMDAAVAGLIVGLSEEPALPSDPPSTVEEPAEEPPTEPEEEQTANDDTEAAAGGYRAAPDARPPADRVRIGFEEEPLPAAVFEESEPSRAPYAAGAALIVLIVLVGVLIVTRG